MNKVSFEIAAYVLFMLAVMQIGLLLVGSWNCASDNKMKVAWFLFMLLYVSFYSIFRQHSARVKFDSEARNTVEAPTLDCDEDCQLANVYGGKTAIGIWHTAEVWVPVFTVVAVIYTLRWRIALKISNRLAKRNQIQREEADPSTDQESDQV